MQVATAVNGMTEEKIAKIRADREAGMKMSAIMKRHECTTHDLYVKCGLKKTKSKLDEAKKRECYRLKQDGVPVSKIAARFGVSTHYAKHAFDEVEEMIKKEAAALQALRELPRELPIDKPKA